MSRRGALVTLALLAAACDGRRVVAGKGAPQSAPGPDACGVDDERARPPIGAVAVGQPYGPYDGPAVVERNVDQLVLTFLAPEYELPRHLRIYGLAEARRFALGAKVWLTLPPHGAVETEPFIVRDAEHGHPLLAVTSADDGPVATRRGASSCSVPIGGDCFSGRLVHESLVVEGDAPVEIPDGQGRTVMIGGVDCDVSVTARTYETRTKQPCSDGPGPQGRRTRLVVRARDLETRAGALEVGPPPACIYGLEPDRYATVGLDHVAGGTKYEGAVTLRRHTTSDAGQDCFDLDGVPYPDQLGSAPLVILCATPGLVDEATVREATWASTRPGLATFRAGPGGRLLLATASSGDYVDVANHLAVELGVGVEAREACAYAMSSGDTLEGASRPKPIYVVRFDFATTTPTSLVQDGHVALTLGDRTFDAWLRAGGPSATVVARR
jgi:hypothetical protein